MATTTKLLTVEDLERMGSVGEDLELIRGVVRERGEMGGRHGEIGIEIILAVGFHVQERGLGRLYTSDTQFVIAHDPDIVVKPDVTFVRTERLPSEREREGIMQFAPDLVVEVVSPTDRFVEVMEKIELYREAGVPLVWLVEPRRRSVTVFAGDAAPRVLTDTDVLDGGDVLPDFRLPVAHIFR